MGDNFYQRYPGDYLRDTMHLTMVEHGAYGLLLDSYYSTGAPLPAHPNALERIARARTKLECVAVKTVSDQFFPVGDDGLRHNARADRELCKRKEYSDAQAMLAHMRWQSKGSTGAYAGAMPPSPSPSPSPKEPTPPPTPTGGGFPNFWEIYPRKTGRDAACRAWISMVQNGDAEKIFKALEWQRESDQWTKDDGKFVPSAEKYLFDRLWTDEPPAATGPRFKPEDLAAFILKKKVVE